MAESKKLLDHDESENRDSVEPVSADLRAQVDSGECVAIRGMCCAVFCVPQEMCGAVLGTLEAERKYSSIHHGGLGGGKWAESYCR